MAEANHKARPDCKAGEMDSSIDGKLCKTTLQRVWLKGGMKNWVRFLINLPHQFSLPVYLIYLVHLLFFFLAWFFAHFYFLFCFPKHLKHTYFVSIIVIIIPTVLTSLICAVVVSASLVLFWYGWKLWFAGMFCLLLFLPDAWDVKLGTIWSLFLALEFFWSHIDQTDNSTPICKDAANP